MAIIITLCVYRLVDYIKNLRKLEECKRDIPVRTSLVHFMLSSLSRYILVLREYK